MNIYWGDIHNHCGISYGYGGLGNALAAAQGQLDFCAITGHAMWPDLLVDEKEIEYTVKYHQKGFRKLQEHWEEVRRTIAAAHAPDEFVTFQGYEIHSREHGDYHLLSTDDGLPIVEAADHRDLIRRLHPREVIAIPHHIGYAPGYRGCNWNTYDERISPVVEIFSKHGCGLSDDSPYPYLHTMGPRDSRSVAYRGLEAGYRFGFVASTDHHAGYPGSYGDGRLAALASSKTREGIWEAILARRTYAVTGDKIQCRFSIDGHGMGSEFEGGGERRIHLDACGCDELDRIVLFKNRKPLQVIDGRLERTSDRSNQYKVRIEMGWGYSEQGYRWSGALSVMNGRILSTEPCFRGRSVLAPTPGMQEDPDINRISNRIVTIADDIAEWECTSFKNPSTHHSLTAAIIFELQGDLDTSLTLRINGIRKRMLLKDLVEGSRSFHMKAYTSEAVRIHRAVNQNEYGYEGTWVDRESGKGMDCYHVEIRQVNGQYAWISPIFVRS